MYHNKCILLNWGQYRKAMIYLKFNLLSSMSLGSKRSILGLKCHSECAVHVLWRIGWERNQCSRTVGLKKFVTRFIEPLFFRACLRAQRMIASHMKWAPVLDFWKERKEAFRVAFGWIQIIPMCVLEESWPHGLIETFVLSGLQNTGNHPLERIFRRNLVW